MNFKSKSLLIFSFILLSVSAFADTPTENSHLSLDKKTGFINNNLIAFSEVKVGAETKKFIALIPSVGSKEIIVYEVEKSTNKLVESARFKKHLHSPFYITFDPSGLNLYGVSSTRNFISQHTFDPVSKKYVAREAKNDPKLLNAYFQTACEDSNFFSFDYSRTLQFFPDKQLAYITCEDESGEPDVIQYRFDSKTGIVKSSNPVISKEDLNAASPLTVLIGSLNNSLYSISIDKKHWLRQYKSDPNGFFRQVGDGFKIDASKIESMAFGPFQKNVYVVARDSAGDSIIVQYKFDTSSERLEKADVVHVLAIPAEIKAHVRVDAVYIQFAPSGKYAYVLDKSNNVIYQFSVQPETGKLTALSPAAFTTCSVVRSLVFDPDPSSHYAYAAAGHAANLEPANDKLCRARMTDPYHRHIDRFVMDPATGQLANFVTR